MEGDLAMGKFPAYARAVFRDMSDISLWHHTVVIVTIPDGRTA